MEIWILIIILLVMAIIFLIASVFTKNDRTIEDEFQSYVTNQSQELFDIKARLTDLENLTQIDQLDGLEVDQLVVEETTEVTTLQDDEVDNHQPAISLETYNQVADLYAQGYTINEISQTLGLNHNEVEDIIDDYIENR